MVLSPILVTPSLTPTLTFDQLLKSHKKKIQRKPMENILYLFHYRFFKALQQPKNRYQIVLDTFISYHNLDKILAKYQRLGLIMQVDYSPNKFMLTTKGLSVLYLIENLNKLLDKYIKLPTT